jgi:hypothetical protein
MPLCMIVSGTNFLSVALQYQAVQRIVTSFRRIGSKIIRVKANIRLPSLSKSSATIALIAENVQWPATVQAEFPIPLFLTNELSKIIGGVFL